MTDILTLARQAGFAVHAAPSINQKIQAFAALVRKDALEEAALKCDAIRSTVDSRNDAYEDGMICGLHDCAKEIRALKESGK